jgi:acetylornithine deacetylase
MIAIPSVNPMGMDHRGEEYSEAQLVDYLFHRIKKIGMDVEVINPGRHPCLVARYDGGHQETVVLDSHLDTVSHLEMKISPFDPKVKEDLMYGRGSCDTKASMACYIDALEKILGLGKKMHKNVILIGCSDEEYAFKGIQILKELDLKADYAIVGEPTELKALYSHKGVYRCYFRAKGLACHSSFPDEGINAIYAIAEVVKRLEGYHKSLQKKHHPIMGRPSVSVGMIGGGTTVNTVPPSAWTEIDRRLIPGESAEDVRLELLNLVKDLDSIEMEAPYVVSNGYEEPQDSMAFQRLGSCCLKHKVNLEKLTASYATHAPFYRDLNIPTLVFGPGSIERAHTDNEYVELDQVDQVSKIIESLMLHS